MKAHLNPIDVEALEAAAQCRRDWLMIRMLYRLGCRVSEALAIEVADIDTAVGTVTIKQLKQRVKLCCPKCDTRLSRSHIYCPGCSLRVEEATKQWFEHRRRRILPIDPETLSMLKDYIDHGGPVNRNGKLMIFGINRHRAWQIVNECADRAGLSQLINPETGKAHHVSPHKLRDAFAVNAVKHDDSGDGLRMLQEHLGHASFNTTAKYRKVSGEEQREWYDRLWQNGDKTDGSQT